MRRELLIGLGEAQVHAGQPEFRETLLEAAEMSLAAGDRDRLIDAALLNNRGMFSSAGYVDEERVAILEAALEQAPSRTRAGRACWPCSPRSCCCRRRRASPGAERRGRRAGTQSRRPRSARVRAHFGVTAVWTAENLAERLETTDEAVRLAEGVGDPHQRFWALVWRATTLTQAGRLEEADRILADLYEIVGRVQDPRLRFVAAAQQAWPRSWPGASTRPSVWPRPPSRSGRTPASRRGDPVRGSADPHPLAPGPARGGGRARGLHRCQRAAGRALSRVSALAAYQAGPTRPRRSASWLRPPSAPSSSRETRSGSVLVHLGRARDAAGRPGNRRDPPHPPAGVRIAW